jgi:hypothetical protein
VLVSLTPAGREVFEGLLVVAANTLAFEVPLAALRFVLGSSRSA